MERATRLKLATFSLGINIIALYRNCIARFATVATNSLDLGPQGRPTHFDYLTKNEGLVDRLRQL
jgi:hypothetical protein